MCVEYTSQSLARTCVLAMLDVVRFECYFGCFKKTSMLCWW